MPWAFNISVVIVPQSSESQGQISTRMASFSAAQHNIRSSRVTHVKVDWMLASVLRACAH